MNDLDPIRNTVADVAHHLDTKRWDELRALYADEVATDYTSLFGGTPQTQRSDALIAGWRSLLANARTHHLLGPIAVDVDGDRVRARCHVRALHYAAGLPGGSEWEVLGHYVFELARGRDGFRIVKMTLHTLHQTGNLEFAAQISR
jgi:hypothetical protein